MRSVAVAVVLAMLLSGCARVSGGAGGRAPTTIPNVLRIADIAEPESLNPLLSTMDLVECLGSLLFSTLVVANDKDELIGDLALAVPSRANGGISADGRTVTYHLHRNVRWHDGVPFTARDVAFTWRAIMNPRNNIVHREGYEEVARIDTPDDATVVVHLKRRYPPFVTLFFTSLQEGAKVVLPAHLLAGLSEINHAPFNAAPVGTGPFRFVKWERGHEIVFARNDAYFRGKPGLQEIRFFAVPDDNTILTLMQRHDIDLVDSVSSALADRYRALPGVKTDLVPSNVASILTLNDSHPGLHDTAVRQAIAMAIDTEALRAKIGHGVPLPAYDIVPRVALGYTKNALYAHDPARARRLLQSAGWSAGEDGIRRKNGNALSLVYVTISGSAGGNAIAVQVQRWLRDVGIDVQLKSFPYNTVFSYDGPIETGRFDIAGYSYTMPWDPDNTTNIACDQWPHAGENTSRFCDPQIDALERAGLETDDTTQRAAIYRRASRLIHEQLPWLVLSNGRRVVPHNVDLHGLAYSRAIAPWWNAWTWSI